jgi:hypothetical protein
MCKTLYNELEFSPSIIVTAETRGTIHQITKTQLNKSPFKLKTTITKKALKVINHNAIPFLMHIILTKRQIGNRQPLLIELP